MLLGLDGSVIDQGNHASDNSNACLIDRLGMAWIGADTYFWVLALSVSPEHHSSLCKC